jgi:uncharacterized protein YbjT (DUF2867 family)
MLHSSAAAYIRLLSSDSSSWKDPGSPNAQTRMRPGPRRRSRGLTATSARSLKVATRLAVVKAPARIALMSSIGVTNRTGAYNRATEAHDWKRRSERLVRATGHPYTIV